MEVGLAAHLGELDLDVDVAAGLRAGRIHGQEAVHLEPVAGYALHVLEGARIGFEVRAVAGGGRDALPRLLGVAANVTVGADAGRHFGVLADLLRALSHPQVELSHVGEHRLLVA